MRPCGPIEKHGPEGLDLVGGKTLTLEECKNLCSRTPTCNALAWRATDNKCHLKKKLSACYDKGCQWNHRWGKDNEWNWYWMACDDGIS